MLCVFLYSRTFKRLWKQVAQNLDIYRNFPRVAGGQYLLLQYIQTDLSK